jgi:hypothetical protein
MYHPQISTLGVSIWILLYIVTIIHSCAHENQKVVSSAATAFLRTFAILQKATISFVMSVRLSAWNILAATGQTAIKFDI